MVPRAAGRPCLRHQARALHLRPVSSRRRRQGCCDGGGARSRVCAGQECTGWVGMVGGVGPDVWAGMSAGCRGTWSMRLCLRSSRMHRARWDAMCVAAGVGARCDLGVSRGGR
eukprot:263099-Chlamydomonas_euryale.AAC.1